MPGTGVSGSTRTWPAIQSASAPAGFSLDFACVGVPRAGTTSLHQLLAAHPRLDIPSTPKETHFFDRHYGKGLGWYQRHFQGGVGLTSGEVAPSYLRDPRAAERLFEHNRDLRVVVSLRHPVSRTISHFAYLRHHFGVQGSMREGLRPGREPLDSSLYATHLRRFMTLFGPERIHVVVFERLISDPQTALDDLCEWLGVPGLGVSELPRANAVSVPRFSRLWRAARSARSLLYGMGLPAAVGWAKRRGVPALMAKRAGPSLVASDLEPAVLGELYDRLGPEVQELSTLFSVDFEEIWEMAPPSIDRFRARVDARIRSDWPKGP